ncbi:TVP38/TMEM64 family protein [Natronobiforma cellulositropha]|uniref:TVP38/TMEM64 family protein n=1 Tax=Natronobiforma cellulositropha TaxID=1679076 RepID=UPI0021D600DF|nr:VTT domain-containing protein [Natronobiforma cellulositropha]
MLRPTSRRALAGLVVLGALLTAGVVFSPTAVVGGLESVSSDPVRFGLLVAGLYLVRPLFAWPTTPLAVVVGYGFGVRVGVAVALVGVVCTVIPTFLAARWFAAGEPTEPPATRLECALEGTGRALARYYEHAGPVRGVVASRLAPIPSDVSTAAAAVSGVRLRHLVVGTALGELPWTVAGVVVGASAATLTAEGLGELGLGFALACALAAVLVLAGPAYRHLRGRERADGETPA